MGVARRAGVRVGRGVGAISTCPDSAGVGAIDSTRVGVTTLRKAKIAAPPITPMHRQATTSPPSSHQTIFADEVVDELEVDAPEALSEGDLGSGPGSKGV